MNLNKNKRKRIELTDNSSSHVSSQMFRSKLNRLSKSEKEYFDEHEKEWSKENYMFWLGSYPVKIRQNEKHESKLRPDNSEHEFEYKDPTILDKVIRTFQWFQHFENPKNNNRMNEIVFDQCKKETLDLRIAKRLENIQINLTEIFQLRKCQEEMSVLPVYVQGRLCNAFPAFIIMTSSLVNPDDEDRVLLLTNTNITNLLGSHKQAFSLFATTWEINHYKTILKPVSTSDIQYIRFPQNFMEHSNIVHFLIYDYVCSFLNDDLFDLVLSYFVGCEGLLRLPKNFFVRPDLKPNESITINYHKQLEYVNNPCLYAKKHINSFLFDNYGF